MGFLHSWVPPPPSGKLRSLKCDVGVGGDHEGTFWGSSLAGCLDPSQGRGQGLVSGRHKDGASKDRGQRLGLAKKFSKELCVTFLQTQMSVEKMAPQLRVLFLMSGNSQPL